MMAPIRILGLSYSAAISGEGGELFQRIEIREDGNGSFLAFGDNVKLSTVHVIKVVKYNHAFSHHGFFI